MAAEIRIASGPPQPWPGETSAQAAGRDRERLVAFRSGWLAGAWPDFESYTHRRHGAVRARILRALEAAGLPDVCERVRACGAQTWVYRNDDWPHEFRLRTHMCGHRWCPLCAGTYVRALKCHAFKFIPYPKGKLLFLTLTQLQVAGEGLSDSIRRLLKGFRKLRRTALWKATVFGGLYVLETTGSKTYARTFHAHLHIIMDARFLPFRQLSVEWNQITGATQLSVTPVRNDASLQCYLAKYLSKPYDAALGQDDEALAQMVKSLHNKPLIKTFGGWSKVGLVSQAKKQHERKRYPQAGRWTYYGEVGFLLRSACAGSDESERRLREMGFGDVPLDMKTLQSVASKPHISRKGQDLWSLPPPELTPVPA